MNLQRYNDRDRMNHWAVVLLFLCAAFSGLAFFHPAFYFFTNFFGGGPWTRILHPFFGLLVFAGFVGMYLRMWRHNVLEPVDHEWLSKTREIVAGNKAAAPPVGRYNAGQKLVFWVMTGSLLVLVITGFVFWRPWFAGYFAIGLIRVATVLHAIAATLLVLGVIVHVYAAIWVKGTIRAMTRGTVTEAWARKNHPLWHREVTGSK
jgi:formate dehydrogenase subunit gamma